jgi:hypothetical protein
MEDRIVINPQLCHGKPVIRGTRTPVTVLLNALAGGDNFETLQKDMTSRPTIFGPALLSPPRRSAKSPTVL